MDGAGAITFLGALGGVRIDHALANVALLEHPALGSRPATMYDERATRISLLAGVRDLAGRVGDLVTLLPLGGAAEGVVTAGLRFPLAGETLELGRSRGLSNVRTSPVARVSVESGRLLVIETPATLPP
jgi:thiamine pyrophosphokinase